MLDRGIISFVSFITGFGIMSLLYDYRLYQNALAISTPYLSTGAPADHSFILKGFFTLSFMILTIVLVLVKSKNEEEDI